MKQYLVLYEIHYDKTHIGRGVGPQAMAIVAANINEAEVTAAHAATVMDKVSGDGANWKIKSITKIGVDLQ